VDKDRLIYFISRTDFPRVANIENISEMYDGYELFKNDFFSRNINAKFQIWEFKLRNNAYMLFIRDNELLFQIEGIFPRMQGIKSTRSSAVDYFYKKYEKPFEKERIAICSYRYDRKDSAQKKALVVKYYSSIVEINKTKNHNQISYPVLSHSWTVLSKTHAVKKMDRSSFLHKGTGIPKEIRFFFTINEMTDQDSRRKVSLKNDNIFYFGEFQYISDGRTRLLWNKDFAELIATKYPEHFNACVDGIEENLDFPILKFNRSGVDTYNIFFIDPVNIDKINQDVESDLIEEYGYAEGTIREYFGKRFERDARNRKRAIEIHGYNCGVCNFNFESVYGQHGTGFIEVHHVKPISDFEGQEQIINPETDLVPLCSNCHRMIHRYRNEILSIEDLKQKMKIRIK
jgi:5-methylcytosine-specific restriction protein A